MPTTRADPNYFRKNFMGVYDVSDPDDVIFAPGEKTFMLDALDQNLIELMNALRTEALETLNTGEKLTTLCYRYYGHTSSWWIVLMYNGLSTPMQIQPGMQIRMPSRALISKFLTDFVIPQNKGRLITLP